MLPDWYVGHVLSIVANESRINVDAQDTLIDDRW